MYSICLTLADKYAVMPGNRGQRNTTDANWLETVSGAVLAVTAMSVYVCACASVYVESTGRDSQKPKGESLLSYSVCPLSHCSQFFLVPRHSSLLTVFSPLPHFRPLIFIALIIPIIIFLLLIIIPIMLPCFKSSSSPLFLPFCQRGLIRLHKKKSGHGQSQRASCLSQK